MPGLQLRCVDELEHGAQSQRADATPCSNADRRSRCSIGLPLNSGRIVATLLQKEFSEHEGERRIVADYSDVLGNRPNRRIQIYPTLDHFRRASESGWMRPFDLAEYEASRNAESEWPARSFVPAEMKHPGMRGALNGESEEAHAGADRELTAAE
jgi:hypothetical protein